MTPLVINSIAFALSLALVVGYHIYLRYNVRRNSAYTIQAINNQARESWVANIMATRSEAVLAVQTLRNSTMAATFLASTAILLSIGVLNLMQKNDTLSNILSPMHAGTAEFANNLWAVKLLPLLVVFFSAFFCFSLAVRMYNHVGYLINASNDRDFCLAPGYVSRLLNRSGRYYSLGMRAYYLSVPLVFWLFGPLYLLAASVGMVIVLHHVDRAPAPTEPFRARDSELQTGTGTPPNIAIIARKTAGAE